jgi:phospholipase/carboxylesterase
MTEGLEFIHRFVPAEDSASGETLVVLHGTGGDENDLIGIGKAIAPGAAIVSPRGNVLENGAPRFFRRLAEGVFDPKEVRSRAEELARFIRAAVITYRLDPARVFALGSAVFISAGRMDPIVPTASVERLVELFESAHAEVTLKWQLAGHNLVPSEVSEAADWLALQRTRV